MLVKVWSLLCIWLFPVAMPTVNYQKIATRDMKCSVLLHMRGKRMGHNGKMHTIRAGCSGTYISPMEILTAAHCFEGYDVEKVWARGPNEILGYPVHFERSNVGMDLALVVSPFPHPYAKLGASPHVGEEVLNVGSPLMFEFVATSGIVSLVHFVADGFTGTYTITTAMIDHGSSGGGCFDRKGRLIGVNTMSVGLFGWGGLSMAVDIETIKQFLRGA